jgi:uncharacterized membrane protein YeaQ/YmgE (transglycosylase-associated protein family)
MFNLARGAQDRGVDATTWSIVITLEDLMNPAYGYLGWIIIGALAGWIASKLMGTDAKQGGLANIAVGIVGAVVGGFVTNRFFGDNLGNNGFGGSFAVALLGSCIVIFVWKAFSRARA